MKLCPYTLLFVPALGLAAQQPAATPTQLTIYNGDFAVARTQVPLALHAGVNEVLTTDVTSQLEPDSVVLRDPAGSRPLRILEQNYDAGVVTQEWLLNKYEGKTLQFQVFGAHTQTDKDGHESLAPNVYVSGRVVRAGNQPLIEVDGHLQFQLPGLPVFPASTDGLLLKPTLRWQIESPRPERLNAELDYLTHGLNWYATYNVVVPEAATGTGTELAEVFGWVTVTNESGTDFPQATIQLMAGDVAKLPQPRQLRNQYMAMGQSVTVEDGAVVSEKPFDDFHLYDLHRTVSLGNGETKQVQFLEAAGVTVERTYVYDSYGPGQSPIGPVFHNEDPNWGAGGSKTVAIRQTIRNTETNHLGMPLPAGRLRLYRRESAGQMQFVGESRIQHTPAEQSLEVTSGNAFDLTAERRQTDFHIDRQARTMDESFEIKLSNAKAQAVTIHVAEHLNRGQNWQITAKSQDFAKRNSATIDFPVSVPAKGSTTLTYTVHYSW